LSPREAIIAKKGLHMSIEAPQLNLIVLKRDILMREKKISNRLNSYLRSNTNFKILIKVLDKNLEKNKQL
jgi:hypothetical protein